ncbi:MAG: protein kinase, partial [Deltaproteobacteria bacterium]|nr:protein kinase [Deltaproteobacteria bacterium]
MVPMGGSPEQREAVLGKYQLMQELAVGGMARLYIARAKGLADFSKPVVLKRILPQYAADPNFVGMFLDEARLAATLHHPNVVQVYDIGQLEGEYFFTMEFVHGESLSRIMTQLTEEGRRLPLEHAVAVAIGVASGLHYAHSKLDDQGQPMHIVHRDVAPSNILISYNGGVKLVDFGIAKAATRHYATEVGTLKGRVAYMSPEQSTGAEIDARSDIFSIGVVLYEIVVGRRMHGDANQLAILHKLLNFDIEPPSHHWPECPPELERIIMRALRPNPNDRYQSAAEMQLELETFAHSSGLFLSSVRMSKFMRVLFGDKPEPWAEETAHTRIQQTTARAELLDQLEANKPSSEPKVLPLAEPAPRRRLGLTLVMILMLLAGAGALVLLATGAFNELVGGAQQPAVKPTPSVQGGASVPAAADGTQDRDQSASPVSEQDPEPTEAKPEAGAVASEDQPPATEGKLEADDNKTDSKADEKSKTGKGKTGKGKTGKSKTDNSKTDNSKTD